MAFKFNRYEQMLQELSMVSFAPSQQGTDAWIQNALRQEVQFTEPQLHEIVHLYNIFCMPSRYEATQANHK